MHDQSLEQRIDHIGAQIVAAAEALDALRADMEINTRVESRNTHEINKLKRHVAKLQTDAKPETPAEHTVAPSAS